MTDRAYARISLDTKVSGSITKQKAQIERVAQDPEWYVDESVSGSKIPFAERPAGGQLLADLQRGDRVLVTKIDRAARNVRDLLGLVERIEKAGASIVFVEQNLDTAGPMGRFMLTLLGAVAELEAAIIAERRRESLASFREEGRHAVGRAPYGLQSVPNPNGRGLVLRPHPEEAPRLREIVQRLLAGESQRTLCRELGVMQEPAFSRLLRNARLAGVVSNGSTGLRYDPDQAVFSPAEWQRLQEFLDRPEKAWSRADGYGAALSCGVCGERLYLNVAARKPEYATYRCRKAKHRPGQPSASVIRLNADRRVEEDFLARFGDLPVTERVEIGSSEARDEAIALARMNLDAIRQAQDEADTDDEEEALFQAYRQAKRALREAEALPTETRIEEVPTGQTYRDAWAVADDETRTTYLRKVGPWVVEPGRLPIDEKVHLDPAAQDYLAGQI